MLSITAARISGYRIRLTVVTDVVGETMTITRLWSSTETPVLGGIAVPSGSMQLDDAAAAPLNALLTWRVHLSSGEMATSGPLSVLSSTALLSDPHRGIVVPVEVGYWSPAVSSARAEMVEIEGLSEPVVVSDVETSPTAPLELRTITDTDADALDSLAMAGSRLLLRTLSTRSRWHGGWLISIGRRTTEGQDWRLGATHVWDQMMRVSAPTPTIPALSDTLGDIEDSFPGGTLGSIEDAFPGGTLGDIEATDWQAYG